MDHDLNMITLADVDMFFEFTPEQFEHMAECVRKHGLTADGIADYCDSETIKGFSLDFVFQCVLEEVSQEDPIAATMLTKLSESLNP